MQCFCRVEEGAVDTETVHGRLQLLRNLPTFADATADQFPSMAYTVSDLAYRAGEVLLCQRVRFVEIFEMRQGSAFGRKYLDGGGYRVPGGVLDR